MRTGWLWPGVRDGDAPGPPWPRGQPLRLEGVRLRRGAAEVLRGIDLAFEPGRRYVVLGASGAGKSSLLRLLNRLEDPSAGRVLVGEAPLATLPVRAVRRGVGLVPQSARFLPGTVADNLAYPFEVAGRPAPPAERQAGALAEVGLDPGWLGREAAGLSGGERQRLALAVALGTDPEVLVLDEPTAALDPASARRVAECLDRRAAAGLRTIAVCHDREHAAWLGETAVVLDAGRVVDRGPIRDVLARCDAAVWAGEEAP
jgi:ABC-type methionine transport system ATPase subunit